LFNEYDSCWTEIGWPSAPSLFESCNNLNEKKEPETMSSLTSSIPEATMKTGSTKEKPRRTQAEVRRTHEIRLFLHINPFFIRGQKSRDLQQVRAKRDSKDMATNVAKTHEEGRYFTQRYATVCNDLTFWRLNQGRFSIPEYQLSSTYLPTFLEYPI
jgi:hypothetical protein